MAKGRTTFIVSHRLNTVIDADEILVMEEGRIVQRGTHADLIQDRGCYRDLYRLYYGLADEDETPVGREEIEVEIAT